MKPLYLFILCLLFATSVLASPIMETTSLITTSISGTNGGSKSETSQDGDGTTGYGDGGISCNLQFWIGSDYCKKVFCPMYMKSNDCEKTPASKHLCCINYYTKPAISNVEEAPVIESPAEENTPTEGEYVLQINVEEPPSEEEEKKDNWLGKIIITAMILSAMIVDIIINARKKDGTGNYKEKGNTVRMR